MEEIGSDGVVAEAPIAALRLAGLTAMIIGYARVSSTGRSLDVQIKALTAGGCDKIYSEKRRQDLR